MSCFFVSIISVWSVPAQFDDYQNRCNSLQSQDKWGFNIIGFLNASNSDPRRLESHHFIDVLDEEFSNRFVAASARKQQQRQRTSSRGIVRSEDLSAPRPLHQCNWVPRRKRDCFKLSADRVRSICAEDISNRRLRSQNVSSSNTSQPVMAHSWQCTHAIK
jgi:hypothetical protein